MKCDYEYDYDPQNDQSGSFPEALAQTSKSALNNPVLPPGCDLFAPTSAQKLKWEFTNRNPVPFAKAWKGFHSSHAIEAR